MLRHTTHTHKLSHLKEHSSNYIYFHLTRYSLFKPNSPPNMLTNTYIQLFINVFPAFLVQFYISRRAIMRDMIFFSYSYLEEPSTLSTTGFTQVRDTVRNIFARLSGEVILDHLTLSLTPLIIP